MKKAPVHKKLVATWTLALLLFVPLAPLSAQFNWLGADPGDWEDGENWDRGSVPVGSEVFVGSGEAQISSAVPSPVGFNISGTGVVTVLSGGTLTASPGGNWVVGRFGGSTGTLNVEEGALVEVVEFVRLTVGPGGSAGGTINQSGGEVIVNDVFLVGDRSGGVGFYNISGGHLRHQTSGEFRVGLLDPAYGTFTISGDEAVMENESLASGTLVEATRGIEIGREGEGNLVQTGGTLIVTGGVMNLSTISTGKGEVTVSGGSFQIPENTLRVNAGIGIFRVDGSGASQIVIGDNMEFGRSDTEATVAVNFDAGGSTLIDVANEADLSDATLEAGVLAGFDGNVGDTYDVLTAANIDTEGLELVNTSGYEFSLTTVEEGNGELLRLTLENVPDPKPEIRVVASDFTRPLPERLRIDFTSPFSAGAHLIQKTETLDPNDWGAEQQVQWEVLGNRQFRATVPMPDDPKVFYRVVVEE